MAFFDKIKQGLKKTRDAISGSVSEVLKSFAKIDEELFEELEEALIMADIGAYTAANVCSMLRDRVKEKKLTEPEDVREELRAIIAEILDGIPKKEFTEGCMHVMLIVGVNGVGKTTSIGKIATKFTCDGKKTVLAAADTFRAAAADQLEIWAERSGAEIVRHGEGADPSAVLFDAANAAKARHADILICDTAGRLHNKQNLMNELSKMSRVLDRELPGAERETLLVLDATTGQNAVNQAKEFNQVAPLDGIILTKLDGTAKGGIVISIAESLKIPVRYVGVGEGADDLLEFNAKEFSDALF